MPVQGCFLRLETGLLAGLGILSGLGGGMFEFGVHGFGGGFSSE